MQLQAFADVIIKSHAVRGDVLTIEGIATTPRTDRVNDIVEPMGAKFKVPLPLCMHHKSSEVVGNVVFARATPEGITFRAELPYVKEPGRVKDRIDEAIHSIKHKLLNFVSIGAKPERGSVEMLKNGGVRYKAWEWLHLALCSEPANPDAMITAIKSFNDTQRALSSKSVVSLSLSAEAVPTYSQGKKQMNLNDSLSAAVKRRDDLATAHRTALDAMLEKGTTLEASEQEEQSKRLEDIEKLDEHIDFLQRSEATLSKAKPVRRNDSGVDIGAGPMFQKINKEPGIALAQGMRCLYKAGGVAYIAAEIAKKEYRDDPRVAMVFKADVPAAAVTQDNWGQDFVNTDGGPFAEFLEFVRPLTIIGQLQGATRVEFLKPVGVQTGGGEGYWVGEGIAKPLTSLAASITRLPPTKVANIIAVTEEWLKYASANNDRRIRDSMAGALQQRLDEDFVDPTVTLSAGVRPASITQGAATQAATGTGDHADIITDFKYMMGVISTQGIRRSPVLIVDSATALALGMMINTFGQKVFPDMSMSGGTFLAGVQVIVSDSVPHASAGGTAILVNAPEILIADEGGFDIAMSRDASLLMTDTDPQTDMSSVPVNGSAAMVSMFQTNSVAFRAERAIGWLRARTTAVAYVTAVNWGAA
jgi:hypothetical protein